MNKLALILVLAACGSSSKSSTTPASPAPTAWKDMNLDQRTEFMKREVMPKAKAIFVAFDEKKYKDMDCATCHGDGAADGSFEMPNPKIKPLPGTEEAFMAWVSKDAEAARYAKMMSEELVPLMANLLGEKAFDPATHSGDFSCQACHTMAPTSN
jgi:cytochrome c553